MVEYWWSLGWQRRDDIGPRKGLHEFNHGAGGGDGGGAGVSCHSESGGAWHLLVCNHSLQQALPATSSKPSSWTAGNFPDPAKTAQPHTVLRLC